MKKYLGFFFILIKPDKLLTWSKNLDKKGGEW